MLFRSHLSPPPGGLLKLYFRCKKDCLFTSELYDLFIAANCELVLISHLEFGELRNILLDTLIDIAVIPIEYQYYLSLFY